ncbi:MAG: hypothetical protein J5663_07670 [Bacteroidaceae bacterium]|nr:hypothetical protein [Bacteroidaceae bacterium]
MFPDTEPSCHVRTSRCPCRHGGCLLHPSCAELLAELVTGFEEGLVTVFHDKADDIHGLSAGKALCVVLVYDH